MNRYYRISLIFSLLFFAMYSSGMQLSLLVHHSRAVISRRCTVPLQRASALQKRALSAKAKIDEDCCGICKKPGMDRFYQTATSRGAHNECLDIIQVAHEDSDALLQALKKRKGFDFIDVRSKIIKKVEKSIQKETGHESLFDFVKNYGINTLKSKIDACTLMYLDLLLHDNRYLFPDIELEKKTK